MTHLLTIGLGGAGMTIAPQVHEHLGGRLVGVNTDAGTLLAKNYDHTLLIGPTTCAGEAALTPERGRLAALESREELENLVKDANRVVVVTGLGGGTGTGSAPVIIEIAHSLGIEVLVVVAVPFAWEGKRRAMAWKYVEELNATGATVLVHDNESVLQEVNDPDIRLDQAFALCSARIASHVAQAVALH